MKSHLKNIKRKFDYTDKSNYDYVSLLTKEYPNFCFKDSNLFPVGIRAQVMSVKAIQKASKFATDKSHREHATTYIIDNPTDFKIGLVEASKNFKELNMPDYTFAVNVKANLEMIKNIVCKLNKEFGFSELSMGMSSDYLEASEHSATYLRIGSGIFGQRSTKF